MSERYCPICKREKLDHWRQKTCSSKCRKAYQRQRQNLYRSAGLAIAEIITIGHTLKARADLADTGNELLREIEKHLRDALKMRPDAEMKALQDMLYERNRKTG